MPTIGRYAERTYALCPPGLHQGVLVDCVDRGFKETPFGLKEQLLFAWQIAEIDPTTGRPFDVIRICTNSMDPKATLRQMFESWRGRPYTDAELRAGVDFEKAIGANCMLHIVHRAGQKPGTVYANVTAVLPCAKGVAKLVPRHYTRAKDRPPRVGAPAPIFPVKVPPATPPAPRPSPLPMAAAPASAPVPAVAVDPLDGPMPTVEPAEPIPPIPGEDDVVDDISFSFGVNDGEPVDDHDGSEGI
jgi:hypothetical protein